MIILLPLLRVNQPDPRAPASLAGAGAETRTGVGVLVGARVFCV